MVASFASFDGKGRGSASDGSRLVALCRLVLASAKLEGGDSFFWAALGEDELARRLWARRAAGLVRAMALRLGPADGVRPLPQPQLILALLTLLDRSRWACARGRPPDEAARAASAVADAARASAGVLHARVGPALDAALACGDKARAGLLAAVAAAPLVHGGAGGTHAPFARSVLVVPSLLPRLEAAGLSAAVPALCSAAAAAAAVSGVLGAEWDDMGGGGGGGEDEKEAEAKEEADSDDDASDSDEDAGAGDRSRERPPPPPACGRAWALSNTAAVLNRAGLARLDAAPAVAAVDALLLLLGGLSSAEVGALRGDGLGPLRAPALLDFLSGLLDGGPAGERVCMLLELLLARWPLGGRELLNAAVFGTPLLPRAWQALRARDGGLETAASDAAPPAVVALASLFCVCFSHHLVVLDDDDFYERQQPFALDEVAQMVPQLRSLLRQLYRRQSAGGALLRLRDRATATFRALRDREARRPFAPAGAFLMQGLAVHDPASMALLGSIPFAVPFEARVRLFEECVRRERAELQVNGLSFMHGMGEVLQVRRDHLVPDAVAAWAKLGEGKRGRVRVVFAGEPGIDGGGLTKEFLASVVNALAAPAAGLFVETPEHLLYPNPACRNLAMYEFAGEIVGKALFEGIVLEPQFATFFNRLVLGRANTINDLFEADRDVYRHLLFVKNFKGDVAGLDVFDDAGRLVTAETRLRFVFSKANHMVNRRIRAQSQAFRHGLCRMVRGEWLDLFQADEFGLLVSGEAAVDLGDWRAHTNYSGGYGPTHELVLWFWEVMEEFSPAQRAEVLRFATSCPRAPLLGFASLEPRFCLQRTSDPDSLPTASTCVHLLRLPRYATKDTLREKLLIASREASGFGLS